MQIFTSLKHFFKTDLTSVKCFKVKIAKLAEKYGLETFIFPENHWHLQTTGVKDILFLVEIHTLKVIECTYSINSIQINNDRRL